MAARRSATRPPSPSPSAWRAIPCRRGADALRAASVLATKGFAAVADIRPSGEALFGPHANHPTGHHGHEAHHDNTETHRPRSYPDRYRQRGARATRPHRRWRPDARDHVSGRPATDVHAGAEDEHARGALSEYRIALTGQDRIARLSRGRHDAAERRLVAGRC